jgi:hypothetical protein
MTTEQLQRHIRKSPFTPFVIRIADGHELPIPHPEFIAHAPGAHTAAVALPDGTIETIDLLLVTALVEQPATGS